MIRSLILTLVFAGAVKSASAGAVITMVKPATYTPGEFTVLVYIEDVNDLASFDLELQLSSTSGVAGTDFGFIELTSVPVTDYVFESDPFAGRAFIQTASTDVALTNAFLTVSDAYNLGSTGVNVGTGPSASRVLAEARIFTTALAGSLTLTFGAGTLLLNSDPIDPTIDISSATFNGDGAIQAAAPVPEPTSFAIFGMGMLGMCIRFRRRSTVPVSS